MELSEALRNDIQEILRSNPNNVAAIVLQGYVGSTALWSATQVLKRARAVPEWWLQFVTADDDTIYIG